MNYSTSKPQKGINITQRSSNIFFQFWRLCFFDIVVVILVVCFSLLQRLNNMYYGTLINKYSIFSSGFIGHFT